MKIKRYKRKIFIIPISSMSDIAFILLIFIILISLINYKKTIKINYPEAKYKESTQGNINIEIWIDKEGNIYNEGKIVDLQSLENIIVDSVTKNPQTRVHIIADKNTPYKNVNGVVEILKLIQHRLVSFVVKD